MALFSIPTLILNRHGVHVGDVAEALDLSLSMVSMMLSGRRRAHPALIPVIRGLAGPDAAAEIDEVLDDREVVSVA